jgi:hypothetical protein
MEWETVLSTFAMQFLLAIAPVLASLAAAWALAKARTAWAELREKQAPTAWWIEQVASMAVKAAEQANVAGLVKEKRDYAFALIEKRLAANGYTLDIDLIYAAIEAAVLDEFNRPELEPQLITVGPSDTE